jgi:Cation/multidrug efflux pump
MKKILAVIALLIIILSLVVVCGTKIYRGANPDSAVENNVVSVVIKLGGIVLFPAQSVEEFVTNPVEEVLSELDGLKEMISFSEESEVKIILKFNEGIDIDAAVSDAREKIDAIRNTLPEETQSPVVSKFDAWDKPVILVFLVSDEYSPRQLLEIAENQLKEKIAGIAGVANIEIAGEGVSAHSNASLNGKTAVSLYIQRESGADIETLEKEISKSAESLKEALGKDITFSIIRNNDVPEIVEIFMQLPPDEKFNKYNGIVKDFENKLISKFKDNIESVSLKTTKHNVFFHVKVKNNPEDFKKQVRPLFSNCYPLFVYFPSDAHDSEKTIFIDIYGTEYNVLRDIAFSFSGKVNMIKGFTDVKIRMYESEERGWYHKNKKRFMQMVAHINKMSRTEAEKEINSLLQNVKLPEGYYYEIAS